MLNRDYFLIITQSPIFFYKISLQCFRSLKSFIMAFVLIRIERSIMAIVNIFLATPLDAYKKYW